MFFSHLSMFSPFGPFVTRHHLFACRYRHATYANATAPAEESRYLLTEEEFADPPDIRYPGVPMSATQGTIKRGGPPALDLTTLAVSSDSPSVVKASPFRGDEALGANPLRASTLRAETPAPALSPPEGGSEEGGNTKEGE